MNYDKYQKYKKKYLLLKNKQIIHQIGGYNHNINLLINLIEKIKQTDKSNILEINNLIQNITRTIEKNEIPINHFMLSNDEDLDTTLDEIKSQLNETNINNLLETRKKIYTINEDNYNEILDYIINKFNILNINDIEKLFKLSVLGYNKNYIINYMVLFRYLIKNKKQLSILNNNITYLSLNSILHYLNQKYNDEEFNILIIKLINEYIKSFPIKKMLIIKNPPELINLFTPKPLDDILNIKYKTELIDKYDAKNNFISYISGDIKGDTRANLDDIKQIINSLFRIPIYES
jgi:hypothetical protein